MTNYSREGYVKNLRDLKTDIATSYISGELYDKAAYCINTLLDIIEVAHYCNNKKIVEEIPS